MVRNRSNTAKRLLISLAGVLAVLLVAGEGVILLLWRFESPLPFLLGLLVGGALSASKVILLEKSLQKTLNMDEKQAENASRAYFLGRYALTIAVLAVVVLLRQYVGIIGCAAGIVAMQIAVYVTNFWESRAAKAPLDTPHPVITDALPDNAREP